MRALLKDNKGFSFIEVIVVVAIIAVLAASSVSAMSYLLRGDIKKATKTVYSEIASNRTYAMAKPGDWIFTVDNSSGVFVLESINAESINADGSYVNPVTYSEEKLSNRVSSIEVKICAADGSVVSDYTTLNSISFKKSTGAVKAVNGITANYGGYAEIKVDISGNSRVLRLYFLTGKIEQV